MYHYNRLDNTPLYSDYKDNNYIKVIESLSNYIVNDLKEKPFKIKIDLIEKTVKIYY